MQTLQPASQKHNHKTCMADAMRAADALCIKDGVRMTPIRRRVLELIWAGHKAVKAYDVLEQLDQNDGAHAPTTVYRALDFLLEHGLVHRVESLNAYFGCAHPSDRHSCQFLICDQCGTVSESCDPGIEARIERNAVQSGFVPRLQMLEVHGLCERCAGA